MSEVAMGSALQSLSNELAAAVAAADARIVRVEARRSNPASGIIWSADGLILTAHHVIERESGISVALADGRVLNGTLVGRDPGSDLALLRVAASDLPTFTSAPATAARPGHLVLAVGRPQALSATLGIVSTVGGPWRTWRGGQIERLIQTDAPFYPGFSGGALLNAEGQLLGLLSSQLGRGLNLVLPTDIAASIATHLSTHGRVRRGYLGIGTQPVALPANLRQSLGLGAETGLLVAMVEPNGPAEQAGLLLGDILIELAGQPVPGLDELQAQLTALSVGSAYPLRLIRGGALTSVTVTIGERQ